MLIEALMVVLLIVVVLVVVPMPADVRRVIGLVLLVLLLVWLARIGGLLP